MRITYPVWNREERRLRLGCRFMLFGAVWLLALGALTAVLMATQGFFSSVVKQLLPEIMAGASDLFGPDPLFSGALYIIAPVATLVAVVLACRVVDRRPLHRLGLRLSAFWFEELTFGLGLGALLMTLVFGLELIAGWVRVEQVGWSAWGAATLFPALAGYVVVYLLVGVYEELLVRGYLLVNLAEGWRRAFGRRGAVLVAWVISSALFGWAHANNPNATSASTMSLMLAGLTLGLPMVITGELAISIGLHITWNLFQGTVYGFPVSGMAPYAALFKIVQGGPDAWTGGVFGPEAGWLGWLAALLGAALTVAWVRWRQGSVAIAEELAAPAMYEVAQPPAEPPLDQDAEAG